MSISKLCSSSLLQISRWAIQLPVSWTVAADIDLRSWLFAFGGGIRVESPDVLRQELVQRCREGMEANEEQPLKPPTPVEQFSPSRLRRD